MDVAENRGKPHGCCLIAVVLLVLVVVVVEVIEILAVLVLVLPAFCWLLGELWELEAKS